MNQLSSLNVRAAGVNGNINVTHAPSQKGFESPVVVKVVVVESAVVLAHKYRRHVSQRSLLSPFNHFFRSCRLFAPVELTHACSVLAVARGAL
jgi:hypothetical protein